MLTCVLNYTLVCNHNYLNNRSSPPRQHEKQTHQQHDIPVKDGLYHTPTTLRRFCKLECSTTKRVPIPNDTSSESSRRDVYNADLDTDTIPTVETSTMEHRPRGGWCDMHATAGARGAPPFFWGFSLEELYTSPKKWFPRKITVLPPWTVPYLTYTKKNSATQD